MTPSNVSRRTALKHPIALCLMLAAAALAPVGFAQVPQSTANDGHRTTRTPALDELVPRLRSAARNEDIEAARALAILTLEGPTMPTSSRR